MKLNKELAYKIREHLPAVREWLKKEAEIAEAPFYSSVDLRDSGYKIVPVDNNLYPAGFNNICPTDQRTSAHVFQKEIEEISKIHGWKNIKKIVIIPESHTTNTFYLENLYYLQNIITAAGFETELGWYPEDATEALHIKSASDKDLVVKPFKTDTGSLVLKNGFKPDLVILNNDFSSGYPKRLDGLSQPILPSHRLGWHTRRKSEHFVHYNRLSQELAEIIGMDPWSLMIETVEVKNVDFESEASLKIIADKAHEVLERLKTSYTERKIRRKPFLFIKSNTGTYGMGIHVIHEAKEILTINRRTKNKLAMGKSGLKTESIIIQEGVPTTTIVDKLTAEPVIYLAGSELIGGFLRTHTEKGDEDNLNSKGMVFRKLCMTDLGDMQSLSRSYSVDIDEDDANEEEPIFEQAYGMIARLSALATGLEIKDHEVNNK
ncbi:MAG: glutamate--cysteine ligase [Xanthomonadaceae bacterium]|nr:glutamate--cysteine ligase [Xanthomonadaceae bacterium]